MATRPHPRNSRIALESIRNVNDTDSPRDVMVTLLAFFRLWHEQPRRFRSDRAARFQAARVLRRMTDVHVGTWFNETTGKAHRVYQDIPARALDELGGLIFRTILPVALNVIRKMEDDEMAERERVNELHRVIAGMDTSGSNTTSAASITTEEGPMAGP